MTVAYMTAKALAERWQCNPSVIYNQVTKGKIPALHIGNGIRIPVAAVEEFEQANTTNLKPVRKARNARLTKKPSGADTPDGQTKSPSKESND